jgi:SDR family mycofactocin-dependent oxidoreductase
VNYSLASTTDLNVMAATDPHRILPLIADVRSRADLAGAVAATLKRFGRIVVVVAAAGVVAGGNPQWETPDELLRSLLDVNVVGVWNATAETIPLMLNGPDPTRCRFVAVASAAGERGLFHLAGYAASKHAVIGIVRGLAADLVGTGITAVAVSPGATDTAMLTATADLYDDIIDPTELATHQGLRRLLDPREIAATIAFCCSPKAPHSMVPSSAPKAASCHDRAHAVSPAGRDRDQTQHHNAQLGRRRGPARGQSNETRTSSQRTAFLSRDRAARHHRHRDGDAGRSTARYRHRRYRARLGAVDSARSTHGRRACLRNAGTT